MSMELTFLPRLRGRCPVGAEGGAACSDFGAPPSTTSWSPSPASGGGKSWATALAGISLLLTLAACGTKGDLECPRGTFPQADGTCRPLVK
jgi:hypothetical protein